MKKVSVLFVLILVIATGVAASEITYLPTAQSFKTDFKNAANASWTINSTFHQVIFELDGKKMTALYTPSGELIGTATAASLEELSIKTKRSIAQKTEGYTIVEALKFDLQDETALYISAVKDNIYIYLKVSETGSVSLVKK